jgi:thiamine biosynthesis protein ThiI
MLRVAARLLEKEGALAIMTGESLGQVASQTLANLAVIAGSVTVPVLHPLITWDKEETITLARRIGTFDATPGDLACRAVPKMPATAAVSEEIALWEERLAIDDLTHEACSALRFVTACNGRITADSESPQE